jgi:hypothetical protein
MSTTKGTHPVAGRRKSAAAMAAWGLLGLLLVLDLALVVGHVRLSPRQWVWNLEAEHGYPERLQYLKWLGASLLLLTLALRRRAAIYFGWAALFLYFLVDDATSLHEQMGEGLARAFGLVRPQRIYVPWFHRLYLRSQDFGELAVALIIAVAIIALLVLLWPPRQAPRERVVTMRLIIWLGVFALFAVGFDMAHVMASLSARTAYVLGIIEDAGEMVCASLLVGGLALELARGERVPWSTRVGLGRGDSPERSAPSTLSAPVARSASRGSE